MCGCIFFLLYLPTSPIYRLSAFFPEAAIGSLICKTLSFRVYRAKVKVTLSYEGHNFFSLSFLHFD